MEMFLMGLCISLFGLGVAALAFGAATRSVSPEAKEQPGLPLVRALAPTRFFSDHVASPAAGPQQVPIEVLLMQIENHVRLEQAAAEMFVKSPTQARLQKKTASPLVN